MNSFFLEPKTIQQDSHMIITNVHKNDKVKYINIDTQFHDEYHTNVTSTDLTASYSMTLPERLNDVKSIEVTNIEFPISYYNISKNLGNNSLTIDSTLYTIPDGNYTATSLMAQLNTTTGLSFSESDHRVSIASAAGKTISFQVNSEKYHIKSKLGWLLGFRKITYDLTNGITGESIINITGPKYLFLALEEYNKNTQINSFISPLSSSFVNKNIIARISLQNSSFGEVLSANLQNGLLISDKRSYNGKNDLQKLNISLLNEIGIPMNLNGLDFSFCIKAVYE